MRTLLTVIAVSALLVGLAGAADAQRLAVAHGPKKGPTEKCKIVGAKGARTRVCTVPGAVPPYRLDAQGVCRDSVSKVLDISVCTNPKADQPLPMKPEKPPRIPRPRLGPKPK